MDLKSVADSHHDETLEQLDSSGNFVPWTKGRFAPVDRFLSNFHKPLQRRMMFTKPSAVLPTSGIIRQKASGEVFLLGQSRTDVTNDKTYSRLTVLHTVSGKNSEKVEYFNYKPVLTDPTDNTDDIGLRSEGEHYLAIEYISTKSQEYGDEAYQGKLVVFASSGTPLQRDGTFTLHGKQYKVIEDYIDSDFKCGVILEQPDDVEPIFYGHIDETTSGYDVDTGNLSVNVQEYRFAGSFDQKKVNSAGRNTLTAYIRHPNPPVEFVTGNFIRFRTNKQARILEVNRDANVIGQTQLVCEA